MPTRVEIVTQNDSIALTQVRSSVAVVETLVGTQGVPGAAGATGAQGSSGVVSVNAPITNSGTSTAADLSLSTNVASGVPTLDGSGLIQTSQLPALAITDTSVVASQAAMLALSAQVGDVAVRSDLSKSYILKATPASTLANWQELLSPPNAVLSVAGRTGAINLSNTDVSGLGTASTKDVPASGNASSSQVVYGTDTRLSDVRVPQYQVITDWTTDANYTLTVTKSCIVLAPIDLSSDGNPKAFCLPADAPNGTEVILAMPDMTNVIYSILNPGDALLYVIATGIDTINDGPEWQETGSLSARRFTKVGANEWRTDAETLTRNGNLYGVTDKGLACQNIGAADNTLSNVNVTNIIGKGVASTVYRSSNIFTGRQSIYLDSGYSGAPYEKGLVVRGVSGQAANLQEWRISDDTSVTAIGSNGKLSLTYPLALTYGPTFPYRAITAARTLDTTDYTVDCTSGSFSVTLPAATGTDMTGRIYNIKNSGTGTITIARTSPNTIDGATSQTLSGRYQTITVQSTGTNWIII